MDLRPYFSGQNAFHITSSKASGLSMPIVTPSAWARSRCDTPDRIPRETRSQRSGASTKGMSR